MTRDIVTNGSLAFEGILLGFHSFSSYTQWDSEYVVVDVLQRVKLCGGGGWFEYVFVHDFGFEI